ncbi:alpha-1,6-mannosyltransferase [Acrasis kona]|uniref:Mannosyltransferase n=1 Tax=Acrasis kona TaxID=1008807 RepID=A0AAW2Z5B8_9EUKA
MFAILGFTAAVFRSDTLVLIAPIALLSVATRQTNLFKGAFVGLFGMIFGIVLSSIVDSYFWGRIVWPEGEVFYYNTVENKSHEWGTLPFHWYFTTALPKALLASTMLIPFGIGRKTGTLLASALLFVFLYSFLPHKELRFILPSVPIFNLVAATGINRLKRINKFLYMVSAVMLMGSIVVPLVMLLASRENYPGAIALKHLHNSVSQDQINTPIHVHMDPETCMSGVSKFLQKNHPKWIYSKKEGNINVNDYSYLLTSNSTTPENFELVHTTNGFSNIDFSSRTINTTPKIFTFKKKERSIVGQPTLSPIVKWAQRSDRLYLTIELYESKNAKVAISSDMKHLLFEAEAKGKLYALDLDLHGTVQPFSDQSRQIYYGTRWIKILLYKSNENAHFWPRLLADKYNKPPFLKIDWDNWVEDEDEETLKREESWFDVDTSTKNEKPTNSDGHALVAGHGSTLKGLRLLPGWKTQYEEVINKHLSNVRNVVPPHQFAYIITGILFVIGFLFHLSAYNFQPLTQVKLKSE